LKKSFAATFDPRTGRPEPNTANQFEDVPAADNWYEIRARDRPHLRVPPGEGRNFDLGAMVITVFRTGPPNCSPPRHAVRVRKAHWPMDRTVDDAGLPAARHHLDLRTGESTTSNRRLRTCPVRADADGQIMLERIAVSAK
jgi:hypothetical protein